MDARAVIEKIAGKTIPPDTKFMDVWSSWYRGEVQDFHNDRIYNGDNYIDVRRKSLGMAKQVCESWANLLLNERVEIVVPESVSDYINAVFNDNNFWVKGNEGVERSFALGLGAFVINVNGIEIGERSEVIKKTEAAKISIEFVNRYKITPITIENKNIVECAFTSVNSDTTNVVVHMRDDKGEYRITNVVLDNEGKIIQRYVIPTKSKIPYFQIIRPNISSNILAAGYDNELGMSVYANSIDTLKAIDNKYDAFDSEYVLGRKKIFVSSEFMNMRTVDGQKRPIFDPYNTLYQILPETTGQQKPTIEDKSGDLRYEAYVQGLNTELNILSMKCGLGESYYRMNPSGVVTATQVMSENSTLFRSLKKHELLLENALRNLVKVIIQATNEFTTVKLEDIKDDEIKIVFDDSIIEDKGAEMERDKADVASGLMSKVEYRMKWYGEDEKTAQESIRKYMIADEYQKYINLVVSGVMSPKKMIMSLYGTTDGYEDEIAYITEMISASPITDMNPLYQGDETGGQQEEDLGNPGEDDES